MTKKINTINLLSLGLIVFSLICLILRTVALLTAFDSQIGYFDKKEIITYFDRSFSAVSIIFGIAVSFLVSKTSVSEESPKSIWSTFASLMFGFIWMVTALLLFLLESGKLSTIGYVSIACSIGATVYYIYEGFRPIKNISAGRALASLVPMVALLSMVFAENFDLTITLNNPDKQLLMFVFVLAVLLMIQKLKFSASTPSAKLYVCSAYLTIFLSLYFAIPGIIGNLLRVTDEPKYLIYYLISIGIAIYSATDLFGRIKLSSFEEEIASDITEK